MTAQSAPPGAEPEPGEDGGGRWYDPVPRIFAFLPEIGDAAAVVYMALCKFADDKGRCWPSVEALAELTHRHPRKVSAHLRRLQDAGLISRKVGGGRRIVTAYTVTAFERNHAGNGTVSEKPCRKRPETLPKTAGNPAENGTRKETIEEDQEGDRSAPPAPAEKKQRGKDDPGQLETRKRAAMDALTSTIPTFPALWRERRKAKGAPPLGNVRQLENLAELLRDHGPEPVLKAVKDATDGAWQSTPVDRYIPRNGSGRRGSPSPSRLPTGFDDDRAAGVLNLFGGSVTGDKP